MKRTNSASTGNGDEVKIGGGWASWQGSLILTELRSQETRSCRTGHGATKLSME